MKQYNNYPYWVDEFGNFFREGKTSPLKQDTNKKGYKRITMSVNGERIRVWVHRVVCELYNAKPTKDDIILHLDNNPSNNHFSNLRWGTHSENMLQCHTEGRCSNIIASNKAKEVTNKRTKLRFKKLLGSRLLNIDFGFRTYITYLCKDCGNQFRSRTDSNVFKRGGDCRRCNMRKDEDIV